MTEQSEPHLVATGIQQEANAARQTHAQGRLEAAESYAIKSQTHLWVVVVSYTAADTMLDAQDGIPGEVPVLDLDNLLGVPIIGCYVCESPYDRRLRHRKCPGEPR